MRFELEFYRTVDGHAPALEYIRKQTDSHKAKIRAALGYLAEVGYMARRPQAEYLGVGLYELRVGIEHHQHRLLYFFHGRAVIVVASGFLKKSDRVPMEEIARADRCRRDWIDRLGGASDEI